LLERLFQVIENALLIGLLVVLGMVRDPWQRIPAVQVWAFGILMRYGEVSPDGDEGGEPEWNALPLRPGELTDVVFTGEPVHHVVELDTAYRILFRDDTGQTAMWSEHGVRKCQLRVRQQPVGTRQGHDTDAVPCSHHRRVRLPAAQHFVFVVSVLLHAR